jgi:predicted Rossmann fold flavoprotein
VKVFESDVIVVGGGASGLMAAGRAAELGARVLLLEKMGRVGIKLALTGKGRCNLTHGGDLYTFIGSYRHNGKFLYNVFSRYFNDDLISFFQRRGLPTVEERGRRVFPASNRAQDVVRALRNYNDSHGVQMTFHAPVREILQEAGRVVGARTRASIFRASRVILAAGGASYPQTGSSGDGYELARHLGHTIEPIKASLVPLETKESFVRDLQGLSLRNVKATLVNAGGRIEEEFGEMLFTHFGVSGPIILTLSGAAVDQLARGRVELSIDFKPALSREKVEKRLVREFEIGGRRKISNILTNLLPQRMVAIFLQRAEISPEQTGGEIRVDGRRRLVQLLKDWRLTLRGPRPIEEAIITSGGIQVREIHPSTMESSIVRGLYFCGEVIDVDGKTGGYNLQAAFSTGWVAGEAAARGL